MQSLSVSDNKKRLELYNQMDQMIIDDASVVVLFYDEVLRFTQKNLSGLGINPTNLLELKKVRKN
jgi:peptide/nickel transport system substrate-binding protein